jgi:hypothetical protein
MVSVAKRKPTNHFSFDKHPNVDASSFSIDIQILNFHFLLNFKRMLRILRKARLKDKEMRVLLLYVSFHLIWRPHLTDKRNSGLDSAGKTTITKKLLGEPIDDISPTLGFQIRTITVDG